MQKAEWEYRVGGGGLLKYFLESRGLAWPSSSQGCRSSSIYICDLRIWNPLAISHFHPPQMHFSFLMKRDVLENQPRVCTQENTRSAQPTMRNTPEPKLLPVSFIYLLVLGHTRLEDIFQASPTWLKHSSG